MDMNTMHLAFPRTCVEEEKKIFVNVAFFPYIWSHLWHDGGDRGMNFTILILLTIERLHTKNGNNSPCSFKGEDKNVK